MVFTAMGTRSNEMSRLYTYFIFPLHQDNIHNISRQFLSLPNANLSLREKKMRTMFTGTQAYVPFELKSALKTIDFGYNRNNPYRLDMLVLHHHTSKHQNTCMHQDMRIFFFPTRVELVYKPYYIGGTDATASTANAGALLIKCAHRRTTFSRQWVWQ